jgi:mono/diheme cytochrome c family protein
MEVMMNKLKVLVPLLITGCGIFAWTQQIPAQDKTTSQAAMSGAELYRVYCASCHGADAKGKGPAAAAMKARVPNLTLLSKNSGGKFPVMKVEQSIQGDVVVISHGSREMPIYGDMFRDIKRDEMFVKQRISLLTGYIESLQVK